MVQRSGQNIMHVSLRKPSDNKSETAIQSMVEISFRDRRRVKGKRLEVKQMIYLHNFLPLRCFLQNYPPLYSYYQFLLYRWIYFLPLPSYHLKMYLNQLFFQSILRFPKKEIIFDFIPKVTLCTKIIHVYHYIHVFCKIITHAFPCSLFKILLFDTTCVRRG